MNTITFIDKAVFYLLTCYAAVFSISSDASTILKLAIIAAGIRCIKKPIRLDLDRGLATTIIFFFCTLLVSSITAYEPLTSFKQVGEYLYYMVPLFLAVLFVKKRKQLIVLLLALVVSTCVSDSYAIWQGLQGQQRAAAFTAHPMLLAGYLVQMLPLILIVLAEKTELRKGMRMGLLVVFLLSLAALIYNGTRGAWVAVAITFSVYGMITVKRNKYILPSIIILFIMTGIVLGMNPAFQNRVQSITDLNNQSNKERILLWKSSWNIIKDHPLTGVGSNNFRILYQEKYILPEAKEPHLTHAHNNFIHIAAEAGILGLTGFVCLFGYILKFSWRQWRACPENIFALGCFLVTISLLLQGLTEFNFFHSRVMRLYWLIVGFMLAYYKIYPMPCKFEEINGYDKIRISELTGARNINIFPNNSK
ncbi:O-antigen ligase family protein [Sporomusa sphaeroides DSM 2875]|uniref:O-antigen ligase family protein n=1 Tax=Sporomusa sphaeroides TaxID=47679 RepID=UPI00202E48E3|nr:O-antigen ligase family protein [Sporomusa sphaeroides]MCM0758019.1 O-antigen ligase family protein [Sporomusa sphaeroides DSM 2875]